MPVSGAAAAIFDERGRVLLVKENYGRRRYGFPGGAREAKETLGDGRTRTCEETGARVAVDYLIGVYQLERGLLVHLYRCRITGGIPAVPSTGEIAEIGWFDPGLLPAPVTNIFHHALPDAVGDAETSSARTYPA